MLDDSGPIWLVLTVSPQESGELQAEGFIPAAALRPAGQGGGSQAWRGTVLENLNTYEPLLAVL